jgi:hypothetical protein
MREWRHEFELTLISVVNAILGGGAGRLALVA